jgi:hypothetical protein
VDVRVRLRNRWRYGTGGVSFADVIQRSVFRQSVRERL